MAFTYKKATDSDLTKEYRAQEKALQETKPAAFVSQEYVPGTAAAMSEEYLNKYLNRGPFKYDLNGDALYRQYKDNAKRQGKMAMADTMGQAAAMTGGYGNSYAQTVGQQVYNNSLAEVNNIIPELWQMAYDKYNAEGNELYSKYGILADKEATEYGRYLDKEQLRRQAWEDEQNDWLTQTGWAREDLNTSIDRDRADAAEENSYAYQLHRDEIEDDQWQQSFDLSKEAAYSTSGSSEPEEKITYLSEGQSSTFYGYLNSGKYDDADRYLDELEAQGVSSSVLKSLYAQLDKKRTATPPKVPTTTYPTIAQRHLLSDLNPGMFN